MEKIGLRNLITSLESGSRPKGGASTSGIPSLCGENINEANILVFNKQKLITNEHFEKMKQGLIEIEDILIVKDGATTGRIGYVGSDFPYEKAAINEHLFRIKVDGKKIIPKYLYFYLTSPLGQSQIMKDFRGATIGGITKSFIDFVNVPLPSLENQERIINVLTLIESIKEKRQFQIKELDELIPNLFFEEFGDPINYINNFKKMLLKDILSEIQTGWSPVASKDPACNEEFGVLKLSAVTGGRFNYKENKKLLEGTPFKYEYEVKKGDVLLTRKNTRELVGACCYVFETQSQLMFSDLIFRLKIKDSTILDPIYLWCLLNNDVIRKEIRLLASGSSGSMPNISKKNLNELSILVPPIELQKEFSIKVTYLETLRNKFKQSLGVYDQLYKSLIQKAFKGELFQD